MRHILPQIRANAYVHVLENVPTILLLLEVPSVTGHQRLLHMNRC